MSAVTIPAITAPVVAVMTAAVAVPVTITVSAAVTVSVAIAMSVAIAVPVMAPALRHCAGADAHRRDGEAGGGKHDCDFHDNSSHAHTAGDEEEYAPVRAWLLNMVVGLGTGFDQRKLAEKSPYRRFNMRGALLTSHSIGCTDSRHPLFLIIGTIERFRSCSCYAPVPDLISTCYSITGG
jgi:hypothetical protein